MIPLATLTSRCIGQSCTTMTTFNFSVIQYTSLDGSCVVKSRQIISVKRQNQHSAENFIKRKYPYILGNYFVELHSTTN